MRGGKRIKSRLKLICIGRDIKCLKRETFKLRSQYCKTNKICK